MSARTRAFYAAHGYPNAVVDIDVRETDDPARVALVLRVDPGPASRVTRRAFVRDGVSYAPDNALDAELSEIQEPYGIGDGDVLDEENLVLADRALTDRLRAAHYHHARVQHQLLVQNSRAFLYVRIDPGPKFVTRYDGLYHFDSDQIDRAPELDKELDKSVRHLASKISDFYVRRGFLDVEVAAEEHLQAYSGSRGSLSPTAGPIELVRRRCARRSKPGQCVPADLPVAPRSACLFDPEGLPLEEPAPDPRLFCVPDPQKGISCEP